MLEEDVAKGKNLRVVFIHGNDEPSAKELQEKFLEKYPETETDISATLARSSEPIWEKEL